MQSGYNIAAPAERLADGVVQSVDVADRLQRQIHATACCIFSTNVAP
jgi:hypothetical protein